MPGSIRLFVTAALRESARIEATPGQAHYLHAVMRRSAGAPVELFNGQDGAWGACITSLRRDQATFDVGHQERAQHAIPDLCLLFAPCKRDAVDLVVQKATELGATRLQPVTTERTQTGRINLDRMRHIAIEAAEQSERLCVPQILPLIRLDQALAHWPPDTLLAVALERGKHPCIALYAEPLSAILIGPEGGFTLAEIEMLRRPVFVRPVSLGARILRAETAAIAGLALLQARLPEIY